MPYRSQPISKVSHAAARDRLTADDQSPAAKAYAIYREMLDDYFRGRGGTTSAEVMAARVRWCAAESRLVSEHAHDTKPMEDTAERWRVHRSRHTTSHR